MRCQLMADYYDEIIWGGKTKTIKTMQWILLYFSVINSQFAGTLSVRTSLEYSCPWPRWRCPRPPVKPHRVCRGPIRRSRSLRSARWAAWRPRLSPRGCGWAATSRYPCGHCSGTRLREIRVLFWVQLLPRLVCKRLMIDPMINPRPI